MTGELLQYLCSPTPVFNNLVCSFSILAKQVLLILMQLIPYVKTGLIAEFHTYAKASTLVTSLPKPAPCNA